ncbi:MAG TPA: ABC transporter permease [Thermoanaerobaculia bacterium]|nr:ABC transporter permease [Thermoanaerobaculia bacterium]
MAPDFASGSPGSTSKPPLSGPLPALLAWRFLRGDHSHRSRLLDGTARSALLATALGVTAMVVAMALMTGYREDLQRKLVRGNAAVVIYPLGGEGTGRVGADTAKRLLGVPGVQQVGRVVYGQGSLSFDHPPNAATGVAGPAGGGDVEVILRGVDPGGGQLAARAGQIEIGKDGLAGVVLGKDLATHLGARQGDVIRLVSLGLSGGRPHFRYRSLRVTDTFATGFAEFDQSWVLLARPVVEELMGGGAGTDLLELTLDDPAQAGEVAEQVEKTLGSGFLVSSWEKLNKELFAALRLQQFALFLVLGLIVLVSTFNVASTLVVLVRERIRDLGTLAALGLPPNQLERTFLLFAGVLGLAGTLIGVAIGTSACWILTTFRLIRFEPEIAAIYFIDYVPFRVAPGYLLVIVGFALLVTLLAAWIPATRAGRLNPSAALRYE